MLSRQTAAAVRSLATVPILSSQTSVGNMQRIHQLLRSRVATRQDAIEMNISSGHWYAVLSSRELRKRPVGKTRFGQRLVFWRDNAGQVACLDDRCPHRGASLSLGCLKDGTVACPYHGFRFTGDGRCVEVPAEGSWEIPAHLRARAMTVRESQDYIWLWRGPKMAAKDLPPVPVQPVAKATTVFEETTQIWPAHYTRCIEGVIDHSHLVFVHKKTIGLFARDPVTRIKVESIADGFRSNLMRDGQVKHHIDLTYPNIWTQNLSDGYGMSTAFAPIDEMTTEVYGRLYHRINVPGLRLLMHGWNRFSQFMVFHEDMEILATQSPAKTDDALDDKLVPSDAAHMAYRKMRQRVLDELNTDEPEHSTRSQSAGSA